MTEVQKSPTDPPRRPVTDSPWFWLVVFLTAAIATLAVVSPKFARRQARLERMNETRERIARERAGFGAASNENPDAAVDSEIAQAGDEAPAPVRDVRSEMPQKSTLGPLAIALCVLLAFTAVAAGLVSYFRSAARGELQHQRRNQQAASKGASP